MDSSKMITGAIVGIVLASLGLMVFIPDRSPAGGENAESTGMASESTASTTIPWIAPGEVQFEATVLIPTEVVAEDGAVLLDYELATLAPGAGSSSSPDGGSTIDALPERWSLSTVSGGSTVDATGPEATSVRFDVRTGLQIEQIGNVRLIGWRVAVPTRERITLDLVPGESGGFAGGTNVTVATILEQSDSTIVLLDIDQPHDRWNRIEIDAVDAGWRRAGRPDGGAQFVWDGLDAPPVLVLEQSSPTWVPVEGNLVVFQGGEE